MSGRGRGGKVKGKATSSDEVIRIYQEYSRISGSRLNSSKCKIMPVKGFQHSDFIDYEFNSVDTVKVCGVFLGAKAKEKNEESILKKVDESINSFQNRKLALFTKATIINTLILAQVWYAASIIYLTPEFIKTLNSRIFTFLWRTSEWIGRKELINEQDDGGLGILDIRTRIDAMRVKYLLQVIDNVESPNSAIVMYWIIAPLKQFFKIQSYNNIPKSSTVTESYQRAVPLVKKVHAEWGHQPIKDPPLWKIYSELIKIVSQNPVSLLFISNQLASMVVRSSRI